MLLVIYSYEFFSSECYFKLSIMNWLCSRSYLKFAHYKQANYFIFMAQKKD